MSGLFLCPFPQISGDEEARNDKLCCFWLFLCPKTGENMEKPKSWLHTKCRSPPFSDDYIHF